MLLAEESVAAYDLLLTSVLGNSTLSKDVVNIFFEWQWNYYVKKHVPQDYIDEVDGFGAAALLRGYQNAKRDLTNAIVIAAVATGDIGFDLFWMLEQECRESLKFSDLCKNITNYSDIKSQFNLVLQNSKIQCSHFGVWGTRTSGGRLYTGRNLDWLSDTGIADYKLITVFHYPGKTTHIALGFAGLMGALAGISEAGITVHEAGDDNKLETLEGFPWTLRLRYIMENAPDFRSALSLWNQTLNTLGINHGLGSAADGSYRVLEVKAGYTATFADNDPREAALVNPSGQQMGFPIPDALWRTNHGYDPVFLETAAVQYPGSDSFNRYLLLHDTFTEYANAKVIIADAQAVNVTSIPGDKGGSSRESFLSCANAVKGENIISVTFKPTAGTQGVGALMYIAFEEGRGSSHVPACCGTYIRIDLSQWFAD